MSSICQSAHMGGRTTRLRSLHKLSLVPFQTRTSIDIDFLPARVSSPRFCSFLGSTKSSELGVKLSHQDWRDV